MQVPLSKGWAHVLQPTPELWTLCLPHRTQIIYSPDISIILNNLDLTPGKIVLEAGKLKSLKLSIFICIIALFAALILVSFTGTGSGSLTHALIRCVKPKGYVHSFDFHAQRARLAQTEFELHKLDQYVSVSSYSHNIFFIISLNYLNNWKIVVLILRWFIQNFCHRSSTVMS